MDGKCPDQTLRMRGINLNLFTLRILEDTFSPCVAQIILSSGLSLKGVFVVVFFFFFFFLLLFFFSVANLQ